MKILVTGGAGFIGSHVVDKFIADGHQVAVIDNYSSGQESNHNDQAEYQKLDIASPEAADFIQSFQPEILSHHAAQINVRASVEDPQNDAQINIIGTLNLLEAAKRSGSVNKIIFASTGGAIYGDTNERPTKEDHRPQPISPYGISKLTVEHYLYYYSTIFGLDYAALRYGNVYGPRQNPHGEAGVVSIFYNLARQGKAFTINGHGNQTRDYVYVSDIARANSLALNDNVTGIINIGTGIETSVNDLAEKMNQSLPEPIELKHGPTKDGEQQTSSLDASKARELMGWQPEVGMDEGLKQTAEFFLNKS